MTSYTDIRTRTSRARTILGRYDIPAPLLAALVAAFILAADNATFWRHAAGLFDPLPLASFTLGIFGLTLSMAVLGLFPRFFKPILVLLLLIGATSSYYMDHLGIVIDRDMIQNVMSTTVTEAHHLITPSFLLHVFLRGLLPSAALLLVRPSFPKRIGKILLHWIVTLSAAIVILAAGTFTYYKDHAFILREHHELMESFQPGAPIAGAFRYAKMLLRSSNATVAPTGADARKGPYLAALAKPSFTVIVVGETARAASFGLNGYERDTTPELRQRNVLYFPDTVSCGTATAVSMPCMFSRFTRSEYSYKKGIANENLVDVLTHAGLEVEWWDNNTGHKNIAKRIPSRRMSDTPDSRFCATGECTDGVFLDPLAEKLASATKDTVIVLHQIGSHGPTYHMRYDAGHALYQPACAKTDLTACSRQEVVNAYDNSIAYTDWFLARIIDMLAQASNVSGTLVYLSDHGESLGENGLYLHGAPYWIAPTMQTRVPFLIWMSQPFEQAMAVDRSCLAGRAQGQSQDALFHSVLGLLDIETSVRNPALDLFAGCRGNARDKTRTGS